MLHCKVRYNLITHIREIRPLYSHAWLFSFGSYAQLPRQLQHMSVAVRLFEGIVRPQRSGGWRFVSTVSLVVAAPKGLTQARMILVRV